MYFLTTYDEKGLYKYSQKSDHLRCLFLLCSSDRLQPPAAGSGVSNMYSYSAGSLARREASRGGRHELEDMLQAVDEVAVTSRRVSSGANAVTSLPRTFTSYRGASRGEAGMSRLHGASKIGVMPVGYEAYSVNSVKCSIDANARKRTRAGQA